MQITIHRGTHEIGGNCVELATRTTRIIIDVGMPLVGPDREPFDTNSIRGKTAAELLASGILPSVPGLFGDGLPPDAILLSHAHSDHTGLIKFANPAIPVHLSKGTSKMLMAGSIFAGQSCVERDQGKVFEPEQPFEVGDFRITAYPVDHSAFDSMAFLIEADGKRLLYSGDLRLHGRKPKMAERLIDAVRQSTVDMLLMEGTHFAPGRGRGITEAELEAEVADLIRSAPGIVLASFSAMHVDRLVSFYNAARQTGRTFIVDPYAAFVMHLVSGQAGIPKPESKHGIRVYYNQHFEETYKQRQIMKIHSMFAHNRIGLDELRSEPNRYVMLFRSTMIDRDFGGKLPDNSRCLYSYWAGYLERPGGPELAAKLREAGGDLIATHSSGHIYADDIAGFVNAISPRTIVPIHTFEPERFAELFPNALLLNDGQMVDVQ